MQAGGPGLERIIWGYQEPFKVPEDLEVPASLLLVVIGESCSHGYKVRATSGFSMLQVALSHVLWCCFSFKLHHLLVHVLT